MCADFTAHGRPGLQQRVPLDRASVTRCSAAWSMAPAGYFHSPDVPDGQRLQSAAGPNQ